MRLRENQLPVSTRTQVSWCSEDAGYHSKFQRRLKWAFMKELREAGLVNSLGYDSSSAGNESVGPFSH